MHVRSELYLLGESECSVIPACDGDSNDDSDDGDDGDDGDQCKIVHVGRCTMAPRQLILKSYIQQVSLLCFLVVTFSGCEGDDIGVCCGACEQSMVGTFMLSR